MGGSPEFEQFRTELTERMARAFEENGLSPLIGRIYSLLISSPEPVSLQEIAERLGVTKAAVSIQIRMLESQGFCMKLARGKDRKDYYSIPDDHVQITMRTVTERLKMEMTWIEDTLRKIPDAAGLAPQEQASLDVLRQRYSEALAFYRVVFHRLDGIEEEVNRTIRELTGRPKRGPQS